MDQQMISRDKRARMILTAAHLGALATGCLAFSIAFDWPDFFKGLPVGILLVSLLLLLHRRLRDEYFEQLWAAGVSLAFIATMAWTFFLPFVEGMIGGVAPPDSYPDLPLTWTGIVCLAGFFIGFHAKLLRGPA
jgi:hypothetical protein